MINNSKTTNFNDNEFVNHAPDGGYKDKKLMMQAVRFNGYNLGYASKELCSDKELAIKAIRNTYMAYEFIGDSLKNDKDILAELEKSYIERPYDSGDKSYIEYLEREHKEFATLVGLFKQSLM